MGSLAIGQNVYLFFSKLDAPIANNGQGRISLTHLVCLRDQWLSERIIFVHRDSVFEEVTSSP